MNGIDKIKILELLLSDDNTDVRIGIGLLNKETNDKTQEIKDLVNECVNDPENRIEITMDDGSKIEPSNTELFNKGKEHLISQMINHIIKRFNEIKNQKT
jgi:hypothetical protein